MRCYPDRVPELWLIRHGESLGNLDGSQADTGLSPAGVEQATALRDELEGRAFDSVLASPLKRAIETAEIALPGSNIVIEPRLRELVVPKEEFFDVAGLGPDEIRRLLAQRPADDPDIETGKQFIERVRGWLARLPSAGTVIAFTHFAVVRECLRLRTGEGPQTIEHCRPYVIG